MIAHNRRPSRRSSIYDKIRYSMLIITVVLAVVRVTQSNTSAYTDRSTTVSPANWNANILDFIEHSRVPRKSENQFDKYTEDKIELTGIYPICMFRAKFHSRARLSSIAL